MIARFGSSLHVRLTLIVILAGLPALAAILYSTERERLQATHDAAQDCLALVQLEAAHQGQFIEAARQLLATIAKLPAVRTEQAAPTSLLLEQILSEYPRYANLAVARADGENWASALPLSKPVNSADRGWFQQAVQTKRFAVGEFQVGRITGKPTINMAYPLIDEAGQVRQVVYLALDSHWLAQWIGRAKLPSGAVLTAIDRRGTVLARTLDAAQWVGRRLPEEPLVTALLKRRVGTEMVRGLDGVERLYAFSPVGPPEGGWSLSVGIPTREIYAGAQERLRRDLVVVVAIALLVIAITWLLGKTLVARPVAALAAAADKVSAGDLETRCTADLPGELGFLAGAFNSMAASLQQRARKQALAEECLRQSEQRLQLHFQQTPLAVIEWDLAFRVAKWNPAAESVFGYTGAEAAGQHASFIVPMGARPQVDAVWSQLLVGKGGNRSTNENLTKDGRTVLCEWYNTPLVNPDGQVIGVASLVQDVTVERRAETRERGRSRVLELLTAGASLPAILNTIAQAVEAEEPTGLCSILLLDEAGQHLVQGAAPSLPEFYNRAIDGIAIGASVGSCGTAASRKERVVVADIQSHPYWADFKALAQQAGLRACWSEPILAAGDQVLGTFALYHREPRAPQPDDLSRIKAAADLACLAIERKRAQEEIQRLNVDLEKRVNERTAELAAANKELEAFSYSVSHDLRSPLRAIDGFSQILLKKHAQQLDPDGQEHLQEVRRASQRMGQLIDDLLNLARITRTEMLRQPVDLSQLAREVVGELQRREPSRQVQVQIGEGLATEGDARLLRVVLSNLLGNAWKFTQKVPAAQIEFGTTNGHSQNAPGQRSPVFYVRDNGVGFDMRYVHKLFGAFQRLHDVAEFEGTGIGLATVQRVIQRHGGRVWAEGEIDKGATFYFSLNKETA